MDCFGCTNYEQLRKKIASIPELINFYCGADKICILTTKEWEERCNKLINSFLSQEGTPPGRRDAYSIPSRANMEKSYEDS